MLREEYVDSTDATFRLYLSASESSRAIAPEELQRDRPRRRVHEDIITVCDHLDEALATAMENALFEQESAGVLVTGSVTVIGERVPCWHSPRRAPQLPGPPLKDLIVI